MNRFDAIVIGTGQAGPTLASRLASAGMQVAVVERQRFGGSCVNTGCTPTKALVASAHAAWMARRASDYGLDTEGVRVDMPRVKDRKDQIVAKAREGLEKWLREEIDGVTVFDGHAHFVGPRRVEVGGATLSADRLFLNVGSRARVPDIPGLDGTEFLTASGMVDLDVLPRHLVVIGGSYVGAAASPWRSPSSGRHVPGRRRPRNSLAARCSAGPMTVGLLPGRHPRIRPRKDAAHGPHERAARPRRV